MRKMDATIGLSINISKIKFMQINTTNNQLSKIKEETIETVKYFCNNQWKVCRRC